MSLLRLLTAGKSLIGVKSTVARYTFSDPRSMPKFRSTVNPFKTKTEKIGAAEPATKVAEARPEAAEPDKGKTEKCGRAEPVATKLDGSVAAVADGMADETAKKAADQELMLDHEATPGGELSADSRSSSRQSSSQKEEDSRSSFLREAESADAGARDSGSGGTSSASPRVSAWISKLSSLTSMWRLPGKANSGRTERPPIQGELSLENIKVVRNDLSESDLEVVAAGSTKASQKGPKRSAATAVPAVESLAEKATATAREHG